MTLILGIIGLKLTTDATKEGDKSMAWLFLMIAGSFEILGVVLLNELSRTKNKIYVIFRISIYIKF